VAVLAALAAPVALAIPVSVPLADDVAVADPDALPVSPATAPTGSTPIELPAAIGI
jgi:hypothetical protein